MDGLLIDGTFLSGRAANHNRHTVSPRAKVIDLVRGNHTVVAHYDEGKHIYWRALCASGEKKAVRLGLAKLAYPKPNRGNVNDIIAQPHCCSICRRFRSTWQPTAATRRCRQEHWRKMRASLALSYRCSFCAPISCRSGKDQAIPSPLRELAQRKALARLHGRRGIPPDHILVLVASLQGRRLEGGGLPGSPSPSRDGRRRRYWQRRGPAQRRRLRVWLAVSASLAASSAVPESLRRWHRV